MNLLKMFLKSNMRAKEWNSFVLLRPFINENELICLATYTVTCVYIVCTN